MKGSKQQFVTIKGTKDGLTLHLDDRCSFQELITEIEEKLSGNQHIQQESPLITVHVKVGMRYITKKEEELLRTLIRKKKNLVVGSIESEVISKAEAQELKKQSEITSVCRMVRSGQVLEVPGDLLLIGDVNPGGTVMAGGNIFVMGSLRGHAYAGIHGDTEAVIVASVMKPTGLKISDILNRALEFSNEETNDMECAYINKEDRIIIDRLQVLSHLRPNLTRLERGI
ncbi:septum site-determining protein MinC [Bacillus suaedaesalsae]|uniref:Probable septum site-determining protein MinC n=1 Tax=Bacillus suaedaesalsae TaxID=2810349 RepID=A0ABS2DMM3_9BACI|nr:septum site-determining protein MinC [Bacillus suaedaesalsae]